MSSSGAHEGRSVWVRSPSGEQSLRVSELGGGWARERQVHAELSGPEISAQCVVATSIEAVLAFLALAERERHSPLGGAQLRAWAPSEQSGAAVLELASTAIPEGSGELIGTGWVLLETRLGRPDGLSAGGEGSWVVRASWPVRPGPLVEELRAGLESPAQVLHPEWGALPA